MIYQITKTGRLPGEQASPVSIQIDTEHRRQDRLRIILAPDDFLHNDKSTRICAYTVSMVIVRAGEDASDTLRAINTRDSQRSKNRVRNLFNKRNSADCLQILPGASLVSSLGTVNKRPTTASSQQTALSVSDHLDSALQIRLADDSVFEPSSGLTSKSQVEEVFTKEGQGSVGVLGKTRLVKKRTSLHATKTTTSVKILSGSLVVLTTSVKDAFRSQFEQLDRRRAFEVIIPPGPAGSYDVYYDIAVRRYDKGIKHYWTSKFLRHSVTYFGGVRTARNLATYQGAFYSPTRIMF